jgi:predicted nucleic acid-binding Zn ribbon protein
MNCVVCGKPNPRGNRWQVCSVGCETVRAKQYVKSPCGTAHCARCGKPFKKPWPKSKYCSVECRCKVQNKKSSDARKVEMKELTAFRKKVFGPHCEVAQRDPDAARHAARLAYLESFFAADEAGARKGLQRA